MSLSNLKAKHLNIRASHWAMIEIWIRDLAREIIGRTNDGLIIGSGDSLDLILTGGTKKTPLGRGGGGELLIEVI
jgi:hypothetical protein